MFSIRRFSAPAGRPPRRRARPDVKGREEILRVHTRKVPISDDVDLSIIARGTPGFSGADLANLVNEAALWAARQNRKFVMMVDFEMSKDKVLMGVERKSMILPMKKRKTRRTTRRATRSSPR